MRTFYIIQMIFGGYYWSNGDRLGYAKYTTEPDEAERFESEEEAIQRAPASEPFTIIKFYDK